MKSLKPYLPNKSRAMALVSLNDRKPFRAFWPLTLVQLVGGKTWSISFIWFNTPKPVSTEKFKMDVREAMDALSSQGDDA